MQRYSIPSIACLVSLIVSAGAPADEPVAADQSQFIALNPQQTVLIDRAKRRVILKTQLVLRSGVLEMLCCLEGTKEHESILSIDADAMDVHAALLQIGAEPGHPVTFVPEYTPPQGEEIIIRLNWKDEEDNWHRHRAQECIRYGIHRYFEYPLDPLPVGLEIDNSEDLRYDEYSKVLVWFGPMAEEQRDELLARHEDAEYRKGILAIFDCGQSRAMDAKWVFAGSGFRKDEQTGEELYKAERGDLICVANFSSATIDVAAPSSASGELLFEPWTERLPAEGTEVIVELIPVSNGQAATNHSDATDARR